MASGGDLDSTLAALAAGAAHDSVTAERLGTADGPGSLVEPPVTHLRPDEQPHYLFASREPVAVDGERQVPPGGGATLIVTDQRLLAVLAGDDGTADRSVSVAHVDRPTVGLTPRAGREAVSPLDDPFDVAVAVRAPLGSLVVVPDQALGYDDLLGLGEFLSQRGWEWADESWWEARFNEAGKLEQRARTAAGDVAPERLAALADDLGDRRVEFLLAGGTYRAGDAPSDAVELPLPSPTATFDWLAVTDRDLTLVAGDERQHLPLAAVERARMAVAPDDGAAYLLVAAGGRVHGFEATDTAADELRAAVTYLTDGE